MHAHPRQFNCFAQNRIHNCPRFALANVAAAAAAAAADVGDANDAKRRRVHLALAGGERARRRVISDVAESMRRRSASVRVHIGLNQRVPLRSPPPNPPPTRPLVGRALIVRRVRTVGGAIPGIKLHRQAGPYNLHVRETVFAKPPHTLQIYLQQQRALAIHRNRERRNGRWWWWCSRGGGDDGDCGGCCCRGGCCGEPVLKYMRIYIVACA